MPQSNWATQTGQDFTNHTLIKDVDFGGIHVWPDNWEMCAVSAQRLTFQSRQQCCRDDLDLAGCIRGSNAASPGPQHTSLPCRTHVWLHHLTAMLMLMLCYQAFCRTPLLCTSFKMRDRWFVRVLTHAGTPVHRKNKKFLTKWVKEHMDESEARAKLVLHCPPLHCML